MKNISFNLDDEIFEKLKLEAKKIGVGYTVYVRMLVIQKIGRVKNEFNS